MLRFVPVNTVHFQLWYTGVVKFRNTLTKAYQKQWESMKTIQQEQRNDGLLKVYIQGDLKVTPYSKIKMVCFWSVISSFIKHEKQVLCMDFHLKFNIFLFVYLNVVEFFKNYYSSQLVC